MTFTESDINEYSVEFKVRNNWLLSKMRDAGFANPAALSRASGVSPSRIGEILNLKKSGMTTKEQWRSAVIKISETLRCLPEDIVPPAHVKLALKNNRASVELSAADIGLLTNSVQLPDAELMQNEARQVLQKLISTLTPREERVVRMRFGLDGHGEQTLEDVAKQFGVTRERVRQIEYKAFRKLKKPSQKAALAILHDALDSEVI